MARPCPSLIPRSPNPAHHEEQPVRRQNHQAGEAGRFLGQPEADAQDLAGDEILADQAVAMGRRPDGSTPGVTAAPSALSRTAFENGVQ
jgi:hypothetical protein